METGDVVGITFYKTQLRMAPLGALQYFIREINSDPGRREGCQEIPSGAPNLQDRRPGATTNR